jgi:two-component system LytT family response regulator
MRTDIRILIVDDEAMACDMLEYLIARHVSNVSAICKVNNAADAIELIHSFHPDLVFLDIQMPFMNGFELLRSVEQKHFSVIFTTAYSRYAIQAIRFSALDYLLKPVDPAELCEAMERFEKRRLETVTLTGLYHNLMENLRQKENKALKLALNHAGGLQITAPSEIVHCAGINNYTRLHLSDNTTIMVSKTIKEFEELLADHGFIRVHKSHLVNMHFVKALKDGNIVLLNGDTTPVSRRRQHQVVGALKQYSR